MNQTRKILENTVQRCRERDIIIPTYREIVNPELVPAGINEELKNIGLWDVNPRNLFRISWKNEPQTTGGGFGNVNYLELPQQLTGVEARIFVLLGKYFPTGSHKVGATFGALIEKLVNGQFDPTTQKALWPSTGNYCRGGAYTARLLGCPSIAVLPEEMSKERYQWLDQIGSEVITTPGGESNVKEIYDKVKELVEKRGHKIVVLNQFEEFGNYLWHYTVTGSAIEEVLKTEISMSQRFSALFLSQGSAGTLGSGDYLRKKYPLLKIGAGEAVQCPTLLYNGFGYHRIEGIGDKHVPWIHNVRNTDMVVDIDDELVYRLMRLFNEPVGQTYLIRQGIDPAMVNKLDHFGISSIANIVGSIKMAKYYEFNTNDVIFTIATDSMDMYRSRLVELQKRFGDYTRTDAAVDYEGRLLGLDKGDLLELSYYDKKRMHNLKYFTWVEQLGKNVDELNAQWYDENYWIKHQKKVDEWDERIMEFNQKTGLLEKYQ